jgi:hypothetical protein
VLSRLSPSCGRLRCCKVRARISPRLARRPERRSRTQGRMPQRRDLLQLERGPGHHRKLAHSLQHQTAAFSARLPATCTTHPDAAARRDLHHELAFHRAWYKISVEPFTSRVKAMVIRDRFISPSSLWKNGIAKRLIGTLRRECMDHFVVFGERHLRCMLITLAAYYNQTRPQRSLRKDLPMRRAIQRNGGISANPILGGLHHQQVRI